MHFRSNLHTQIRSYCQDKRAGAKQATGTAVGLSPWLKNGMILPVFRIGCTSLCLPPPFYLDVVVMKVKVQAKVVERKSDTRTFALKKVADALLGK
jgi:hypothetical protein